MTRTMYDSTTAADIPASATMVAGYVDGKNSRWTAAGWARFPSAAKVRIAVLASTNDGDVLDVEQGDATPAQAPAWITMRQNAGLWRPTIYCELSAAPAVLKACQGLQFDLWTAHYTGKPHICTEVPGVVATQYADPPGSGGHFDLSLVVDDGWPHRTAPTPAPTPEEEGSMVMYHPTGTDPVYIVAGDKFWHVPDPGTRDAYLAAGIPQREIAVAAWTSLITTVLTEAR